MRCQNSQKWMVEALYHELDEERLGQFESHVTECEECGRLLAEMRATLAVMDKREQRDPGEAYWQAYWDRLRTRMVREEVEAEARGGVRDVAWWKRNVLGGAGSRWSWSYRAVAAMAILVIGVFAGRTFFAPGVQTTNQPVVTADQPVDVATPSKGAIDGPAGESTDAPTPRTSDDGAGVQLASATDERAQRYIDKSQMLLLAIVNGEPEVDADGSDFSLYQARSRQLVDEAGELKDELDEAGERRMRELVSQLQRILLEIANLEAEGDVEAVEVIRDRVNRNDVLLKINLEQMRQETGGDGAASGAPQNTEPAQDRQRSI